MGGCAGVWQGERGSARLSNVLVVALCTTMRQHSFPTTAHTNSRTFMYSRQSLLVLELFRLLRHAGSWHHLLLSSLLSRAVPGNFFSCFSTRIFTKDDTTRDKTTRPLRCIHRTLLLIYKRITCHRDFAFDVCGVSSETPRVHWNPRRVSGYRRRDSCTTLITVRLSPRS